MAVGIGYDVHPFDVERSLRLAGVDISAPAGLAGHSDGDIVMHAIADALLGAAGEDDIGMLFPDSDDVNQNRDSADFVREAVSRVRKSGYSIVNIDCVIAIENPKIAPHKEKMRVNISSLVDAPVSIKAKRGEGLGFIGRSEGVACWAVAQIERTNA